MAGGDSLAAARLLARIAAQWGVRVPFATFLDHGTVSALAAAIDSAAEPTRRAAESGVVSPALHLASRSQISTRWSCAWFLVTTKIGSASAGWHTGLCQPPDRNRRRSHAAGVLTNTSGVVGGAFSPASATLPRPMCSRPPKTNRTRPEFCRQFCAEKYRFRSSSAWQSPSKVTSQSDVGLTFRRNGSPFRQLTGTGSHIGSDRELFKPSLSFHMRVGKHVGRMPTSCQPSRASSAPFPFGASGSASGEQFE